MSCKIRERWRLNTIPLSINLYSWLILCCKIYIVCQISLLQSFIAIILHLWRSWTDKQCDQIYIIIYISYACRLQTILKIQFILKHQDLYIRSVQCVHKWFIGFKSERMCINTALCKWCSSIHPHIIMYNMIIMNIT